MLTGLVVGKFCPLHKGHEALIAFARARCDRLLILSYSKPEFPGYPPELRASWLEELYPDAIRLTLDADSLERFSAATGTLTPALPHNDAPEDEHRRFVGWVCQTILGLTVDRVFTSESYGDGFAAVLASEFGRPVEHVLFDPRRSTVPVSGTRLRSDPSSHRRFLSEPVRRSLVRRVGLIGGESTGKTTLAAALAEELGTCWVPEYGRELWEKRRGDLRYDDMLAIAHEQVAREESAMSEAAGWLICDTTPLVTAFYSQALFGRVAPDLQRLAERRYDKLLLCAADVPFVQDGTRRDATFRQGQNVWYGEFLDAMKVPYDTVTGPPSARVSTVLGCLRPVASAKTVLALTLDPENRSFGRHSRLMRLLTLTTHRRNPL